MLAVASDPFAISTMAHALYDILPFLDKTRASSFFALSSLFITADFNLRKPQSYLQRTVCKSHTRTTRRWNDCSFQPRQLP